MTNYMQLKILKEGVDVWNKWRKENPESKIELMRADLWQANLRGASLSGANLSGADLRDTNLSETYLREANLSGANLSGANLNQSDLRDANLSRTLFIETNLTRANLFHTNLKGANLGFADLRGAALSSADFRETNLHGASLVEVDLGDTIFVRIDLSETYGLESVKHNFPSTVSTDTIQLSKGKIPKVFLRGCGLSDWEIESAKLYNPDLNNQKIDEILYKIHDLRASQSLQVSPLFISYSHNDSRFVDKLEYHLNERGVRFWRDIHDAKAGRLEKQIDTAIRQNPTVLLILSEHSIKSDWVEHEVRTARGLEKEIGRDVLCPIALDDSWKNSLWPRRVMEQVMEYNILDFSTWKDDSKFGSTFNKLVDGLGLFYKG